MVCNFFLVKFLLFLFVCFWFCNQVSLKGLVGSIFLFTLPEKFNNITITCSLKNLRPILYRELLFFPLSKGPEGLRLSSKGCAQSALSSQGSPTCQFIYSHSKVPALTSACVVLKNFSNFKFSFVCTRKNIHIFVICAGLSCVLVKGSLRISSLPHCQTEIQWF